MGKEKFIIARIFGAYYELYSKEKGYQRAVLKGKFRLKASEERHPFVVGDLVFAEPQTSSGEFVIMEKVERRNALTRKSDKGDNHVLAGNLDQVAILASCQDPETKEGFIDRLFATVSPTGIEPLLVFTKKDLITSDYLKEKEEAYRKLGYHVLSISLNDQKSLEEFRNVIQGKVTFLCGNSGVGKSSLLNALTAMTDESHAKQTVNTISETTKKGKHTTTNSFALFLDPETVLIDSPGVKEWGILHLSREEIFFSFPELQIAKSACEFEYCCDLGTSCLAMQCYEEKLEDQRRKSLDSMLESLDKPHRTTRRDHWSEGGTDRRPGRL